MFFIVLVLYRNQLVIRDQARAFLADNVLQFILDEM